MYEIYLEHSAEKDLRKLRPPFFNTVLAKIKALANNPHPRGSRKIMDSDNFWRIRIGSYRVLLKLSIPKILLGFIKLDIEKMLINKKADIIT